MLIEPMTTPIAIIDKSPVAGVNYWQAAITALFAVGSGFILYIIKTIIDEVYLRQYRDYKKIKAEISYTLIMYANAYMNLMKHNELTDEASNALRNCAAQLGAFVEEWPRMRLGIPNKKTLNDVKKELIGLSNRTCDNNVHDIYDDIEQNEKARKKIVGLLKVKNID